MPYMYRGVKLTPREPLLSTGRSSTGMRVAVLDCGGDLGRQRWTVDTKEDLEFVRGVYAAFHGRWDFTWQEVSELLREHPELLEINAGVRHKDVGEVDSRASGGGRL